MKKLPSFQTIASLAFLGMWACSNVTFQPEQPVIPVQPVQEQKPIPPVISSNQYGLAEWVMPFGNPLTQITKAPIVSPSLPQPSGKADLSFLRSGNNGEEPGYIALGGTLTMGYRDGGLHRAGQLTAYPNLIARQMGLTQFRSPLFGENEANGTGYMVYSGKDGIPEWQYVTNNRAIVTENPLSLTPYQGEEVNNLGAPDAGFGMHMRYYEGQSIQSPYEIFEARIRSEEMRKKQSLLEYTKSKHPSLLTVEKEIERVMKAALSANNINVGLGLITGAEQNGQRQLLTFMKEENIKGVVFLIPTNLLDLPYFRLVTLKSIKEKTGASQVMVYSDKRGGVRELATDNTVFLPKGSVVNLLKGPKKMGEKVEVNDTDSYTEFEFFNFLEVKNFNQTLRKDAEDYGVPVVDLDALYKKVMAGQYISEDGFKIDPSFPNGNFFSQDGIYPSAIGQAVIANEVIKVLNASYNSTIPLIHIGNFARLL